MHHLYAMIFFLCKIFKLREFFWGKKKKKRENFVILRDFLNQFLK
jgi:hypothetical protein